MKKKKKNTFVAITFICPWMDGACKYQFWTPIHYCCFVFIVSFRTERRGANVRLKMVCDIIQAHPLP